LDESSLGSLLALIALAALHAWMEFSYAVLTNFRRSPLAERSEAGDKDARRTLSLSNDLTRLYITTQLVLMLTRFAFVALVMLMIADPIILTQMAGSTTLARVAAYALILLPFALLLYLLGDLVPSAFGQLYADQALRAVTRSTRVLVILFRPLVALMMQINRTLARVSGAEDMQKAVTEEEIMTLVDSGEKSGAIEDEEKEMIYSVLQFGETLAREVMVPRPDIVGVELSDTVSHALEQIVESGHSRIPVYEDSVDDVRGILYAKDLLTAWQRGQIEQTTISNLMRPAYFIPETKRADMLFREMQAKNSHIAIVVDEYGGTAGLVTIEDLIEEIVGDIRDEYDVNEQVEYTQISERLFEVDGALNVGDLNSLMDLDLPTEESDSIGGYIYASLGRVPEVGDVVDVPEHRVTLTVEAVENRRIRRVKVEKAEPPPPELTEAEEREAAKQQARATREAQKAEADAADNGAPSARPAGR